MADAERVMAALANMARSGVRLDEASIGRLARAESRGNRSGRLALWVGALCTGGAGHSGGRRPLLISA